VILTVRPARLGQGFDHGQALATAQRRHREVADLLGREVDLSGAVRSQQAVLSPSRS
jgi:hypothetical protein